MAEPFASLECPLQAFEKQPPEQSGESTATGRKKPGRHAIQRLPSGDSPPPGTTQWRWG
jgi:hypothetical protein